MNWLRNGNRVVLVAALALFAMSGALFAQAQSGNVYGTVKDTEGQPLPGVTVTLSGLGAPQVQVSDAQGQFRFLGLSPGTYKIEANLDAFSPLVYEGVVVNIGKNVTLDLTLNAAISETLTITGESPLLDERKITTGTVVNSTELEKIPTSRDPWSILATTPNVLVDRINVGGNESGQQSTYVGNGDDGDNSTWSVDGVEITDIGALGSSPGYYDFDAFEEMQIETGGADATLRTGGVGMNVVTKRGTNEWRGSARYLKVDNSWQSDTGFSSSDLAPGQPAFESNSIGSVVDKGGEVGGPILKDRLWIWGAYGRQDIDNIVAGGSHDKTELKSWNAKINWQVVQNNSLTMFFFDNDKIKTGRSAGPTRPPETTWNQGGIDPKSTFALWDAIFNKRPTVAKLEDTHIFNSSFYLTGLYSEVSGGFGLTPQGGISDTQDMPVRDRNRVWSNSYLYYYSDRPQDQYKLDGSVFFTTGSVNHELKFGANQREGDVTSLGGWPGGGFALARSTPDLYLVLLTGQFNSGYTAKYQNGYIQDTLTWGNVTANIGARYDKQSAKYIHLCSAASVNFPEYVPELCFGGQDIGYGWKDISPRLGVTYALGEERKTLLRASYSRFVEQIGGTSALATNPLYYYPTYYFFSYDTNQDGKISPAEAVAGTPLGPNATLAGSPGPQGGELSKSVDFQADPNLDAPTTDEITLGVEHALLPEFVVGATLTYRENKKTLYSNTLVFDGDSIDDPNYGGRVDQRSDYVPYETIPVAIPGGGTVMHTIYGLKDGVSTRGGFYTYNSDRKQTYLGAAVTINKRLANNWSLRGNVSYNDWKWDIPASAISDPNQPGAVGGFYAGGNKDGDRVVLCSGGSGAKGGVCFSSSWSFSFTGLYQVAPDRPWGFNVSAALNGREGFASPYSYTSDRPDLPAEQVVYLVSPKPDSQKLDNVMTLDLRLEKEFRLDNFGLTLSADIFNVFNDGTVLQREMDLQSDSGDYVREVLSPRVFRLGARISFN